MPKVIFGITINNESELKNALIKNEIGYLPNAESDLFTTSFVSPEKTKRGSELIFQMFADMENLPENSFA